MPEGMLEAFWSEYSGGPCGPESHRRTVDGLRAVLHWLAEHPIVPSDEQIDILFRKCRLVTVRWDECSWQKRHRDLLCEWQREMFLALEPEIPIEITDLILPDIESGFFKPEVLNARLTEAYRRGQQSKESR